MKQILQNYKTGEVSVADVPPPIAQRGRVIVRTAASLISAGTERMTVELGRKSLLGKARERPDLVRQVFEKAQREGLMATLTAVQSKLNATKALGYSAAGLVTDVGDDVTDFRAGDRVACAGAGFASHAEVLSAPKNLCVRLPAAAGFGAGAVGARRAGAGAGFASHAEVLSVPKNLCVRLPDAVDFEAAAFGTLGAIALQGVRLAEPTLGESIAVGRLGLSGCRTPYL